MKYFLASTVLNFNDRKLIKDNMFLENLRLCLMNDISLLFIASNPKTYEENEKYANELKNALIYENFKIKDFKILDERNKEKAKELVLKSNLVFLAGGHVPTQNKFILEIGLKEIILEYEGVFLSSSAGSMNSACNVYSLPEHPNESLDLEYKRFLKGLAITNKNILPHYNYLKDVILDGKKIIDEIALNDSYNRKFYVLNDGSYIMGERKKSEEIKGYYFIIENGKFKYKVK